MATIRGLEPADLTRPDSLEPLLALVDVLPIRVAPLFTDLVTRMTDEEARAPGGVFSHWPARMHLTWALKDLIAYRETYAHGVFRLSLTSGQRIAFPTSEQGVSSALEAIRLRTRAAKLR